jgi:hypothetical protein
MQYLLSVLPFATMSHSHPMGSRDDSNEYGESGRRRKKPPPLFVRMQQEGERKAEALQREKMCVCRDMLARRRQGNPSHEELLMHKHKYTALKQQEEVCAVLCYAVLCCAVLCYAVL